MQDSSLPLFPPKCTSPMPCPSSLYPHLYLPTSSSTCSTSLPSVVSSVASLSAALSSALQLTTSQGFISTLKEDLIFVSHMQLFSLILSERKNISASTTVSSSALPSTMPTSMSTTSGSGLSSNPSLSSTPPSAPSLAQRKSCEAASLPSSTASSLKTNSSDIKKLDNDGIRVTTAKGDGIRVTSNTGDGIRVTSNATDGIRVTPAGEPGPSPSRPKSLALEPMPVPPNNVAGLNPPLKTNNANAQTSSAEERKSAPTPQSSKLPLSKAAETTCKHKHNNANAKELKKLMGHDCGKPKAGTRKSKSSSAVRDDDGGESTEELSDDSSPEDSCSSSTSGDKHCACCYCEVFGHGGPSVAPVSRNYPEMRERLRLLLSKKKRSHRAQQQQQNGGQATSCPGNGAPHPSAQKAKPSSSVPAPPAASSSRPQAPSQQQQAVKAHQAPQQAPSTSRPQLTPHPQQPASAANKQAPVKMVEANQQRPAAPSISSASPSPVMGVRPPPQEQVKEILAKKDVDEVLEYIEGNKNLSNDKKRLKKERQKQQRAEELRAKQEEERKRKAAEEAARKAREEEERLRKELEEKALKKSKKKAAQKAKKLANSGAAGDSPCPETPDNEPESLLDLENLRLKHIREQKELLEKQKQQLIEQQRKLDEQLTMKIGERNAANAAVSAAEAAKASLSRKQAKRAAKGASPAPTSSLPSGPQVSVTPGPNFGSASVGPGFGAGNPALFPNNQPQPPPYYPGYQQPGGMFQQQQQQQGGGMYPPHMGFQAFPGGPQGFPQGNPYQPQPSRPTPPPASKSDQPMVTIKRVMRPDTNEPTVTISVKKDEDGKEAKPAAQQQDKVLFTLVNGQVMKTANAPDNLIPGAKPMPTELAKRLMPDEGGDVKLSKKQKKKMASKGREAESASNSPAMQRASAPAAPYQQVDLDKLRLPDGVSISKISGPVPERRYFPCKETDAAPRGPGAPGGQNPAPMGPPWTNNPYAAAPPPTYPGATGG